MQSIISRIHSSQHLFWFRFHRTSREFWCGVVCRRTKSSSIAVMITRSWKLFVNVCRRNLPKHLCWVQTCHQMIPSRLQMHSVSFVNIWTMHTYTRMCADSGLVIVFLSYIFDYQSDTDYVSVMSYSQLVRNIMINWILVNQTTTNVCCCCCCNLL